MSTNKRARKQVRIALLAFAFSLVRITALADDPGTPNGNDDPDAPIDGGLSLLIVCGLGYGVKKLGHKKDLSGKHYND